MIYDNYTATMKQKANKRLAIANSRGRKPVMNDIKKAHKIIRDLMIEINPCAGKKQLQQCEKLLLEILNDNI